MEVAPPALFGSRMLARQGVPPGADPATMARDGVAPTGSASQSRASVAPFGGFYAAGPSSGTLGGQPRRDVAGRQEGQAVGTRDFKWRWAHVDRSGRADHYVDLLNQLRPDDKPAHFPTTLAWVDRSSGERYPIATGERGDSEGVARVKTYRDVLREFRGHPEAKSAGPDRRTCGRGTVGLLRRRQVRSVPDLVTYVGKESNRLEEVEAGLGHDPDEVYTQYPDPRRDTWRALVLPVLKHIPAKRLAEETGLAMSTIKAARNGHAVPHGRNRAALARAAAAFARERLKEWGLEPPIDDLATCAAFLASKTS